MEHQFGADLGGVAAVRNCGAAELSSRDFMAAMASSVLPSASSREDSLVAHADVVGVEQEGRRQGPSRRPEKSRLRAVEHSPPRSG
jgi:hypothetical protein